MTALEKQKKQKKFCSGYADTMMTAMNVDFSSPKMKQTEIFSVL